MQYFQIQTVFIAVCVLLSVSCTMSPISEQDESSVLHTESDNIISFFAHDTCVPPCWIGVTPGISTSQEAKEVLLNHELIELPYGYPEFMNGDIDFESDTVTNGWYAFNVGPFDVPSTIQTFSRIVIRDSLVELVSIDVREYITVEKVLNALGEPDQIRLIIDRGPQTFSTGYASFQLQFIYVDQLLRLVFLTDPEPKSSVYCNNNTLQYAFLLSSAIYFSSESAVDEGLSTTTDPQPAIARYDNSNTRYLPDERWNAWLNSSEDLSCEEGWETLSTERIFPDLSDFEENRQ